eukprot:TRINITY_DN798_c0_g1_i1.p1 TRINITY_DN798_c0_g1~~TRINITY_DN798_c0_g1_i1.p1  ORF type:complete len:118 (+),score=38.05 TRINITY_DN798_c0_g1_i1:29-382(+)
MSWTITINEVFTHRGGAGITGTFTQQISPEKTVGEFLTALRNNNNNNQRHHVSINLYRPFEPNQIGSRDRNNGNIISENNNGPNCTWNVDTLNENTLIKDSGLKDGAVLAMRAMMCD